MAKRALLVGPAAGAVAFACGHPYWAAHPWYGVAAVAECVLTAAIGAALIRPPATRPTGALLVLASFAWALSGAGGWHSGILQIGRAHV